MKTRSILLALASGALLTAAPAFAQHGRPAGNPAMGNGGVGMPGLGGAMDPGSQMSRSDGWGETVRDDARARSRASDRAADEAQQHANANSAIYTDSTERARTTGQDRGGRDDDRASTGVTTRAQARENSQGSARADDRAVLRANENSALSTSTTTTPQTSTGPTTGITTRTQARENSQGGLHATARARTQANSNSAIGTDTSTTASDRSPR